MRELLLSMILAFTGTTLCRAQPTPLVSEPPSEQPAPVVSSPSGLLDASVSTAPPSLQAPQVLVVPPASLLDEWLTAAGSNQEVMRYVSGGGLLAAGVALGILGAWELTNSGTSLTDYGWVAFGALGLSAGALAMSLGLFQLIVPSIPESRLARWRQANHDDPAEVGRFEGELRNESVQAEYGRAVVLALGIGAGVGGLGSLITTAALDRNLHDVDRIFGYTLAGGLGLISAVYIVIGLISSPPENTWNAYRSGRGPYSSLQVLPYADPFGGGLMAAGSF